MAAGLKRVSVWIRPSDENALKEWVASRSVQPAASRKKLVRDERQTELGF